MNPRPSRGQWALLLLGPLLGCDPEPLAQIPDFPGDWAAPEGAWPAQGPPRLALTEVDSTYELGAYGVADPDGPIWIAEGGQAHSDAVVGCAGPWLLVINRRYADNLQFIDPQAGVTVAQWSTGNGSNPQAAAFWGQRALISLYDADYLLAADFVTGQELARLDLSPWADDDGLPEASQIFIADDAVWLVLQRLDRDDDYLPAGGSLLLGLDPVTLEVFSEIPLPFDNPSGTWSVAGTTVVASAVGAYLDEAAAALALDGGLFSVDLRSGTTTVLLSEAALGLNLYDAQVDGDTAWLSTYDAEWNNRLEIWDLSTGTQKMVVDEGFFSGWAAPRDGSLWVADRDRARLVKLDWQTADEMDSLDTLLRPSSLTRCGL